MQDYRKREVSDTIWLVFALAAVCVNLLTLDGLYENLSVVLSLGLLQLAVFGGLYWLGAFGGADAKSCLCLGLMYPMTPAFVPLLGTGAELVSVSISSFANSVLLSLVYVPLNLARNAAMTLSGVPFFDKDDTPALKKLAALGLLRRLKVSEFKRSSHAFEFVGHNLSEVSLRSLLSCDRSPYVELGPELGEDAYIYAQPLVPLQVFVLTGFVVTVVLGNVLLAMAHALVG